MASQDGIIQPQTIADVVTLSYTCIKLGDFSLQCKVSATPTFPYFGHYFEWQFMGSLTYPRVLEQYSKTHVFSGITEQYYPMVVTLKIYTSLKDDTYVAMGYVEIDYTYFGKDVVSQMCVKNVDVDGLCCLDSCCTDGNCKKCGESLLYSCCPFATDTCFETGFPDNPAYCCPEGTSVCTDVLGDPYCCAAGECCQGGCCSADRCCNDKCCPAG
jgi:hypothetical protein